MTPPRTLAALLLFAAAAPADLTREKLALLPGLWPWDRRALAATIAGGRPAAEAATAAGVPRAVVERLEALPPGPLMNERYAHGLVLAVPGLTAKQRALFQALVPAVDAAQGALLAHRTRRLASLRADDPERKRVEISHDRQIHEIEHRFWRIAGCALTLAQREALHGLQLAPYSLPPDVLGHIYQLPGLSSAQAGRVRALVAEYESESAADVAEATRIRTRLADAELSAGERAQLAARSVEVGDRVARHFKRAVDASMEIYTHEQLHHLRALVPMLSAADRRRHPGEIVAAMDLGPEQRRRIEELGAKLRATIAGNRAALEAKLHAMGEGEFGAEAPQSMTMEGMRRGNQGEDVLAMEAVARKALLDVLTPAQVVAWVIAP